MRWTGILMAVVLALGCTAGAGYCFARADALQREAAWALTRAGAHAAEYARSLSGSEVDDELRTLAQRRALLEQAHVWQGGQQLAVVGAVVALLAAYGLFLRLRLREQRVGGESPGSVEAPPLGALAPPAAR